MSLDEIERAIVCGLSPSIDAATKEAAMAFCTVVRTSEQALSISSQLLLRSATAEVRFWSLQVMHEFLDSKWAQHDLCFSLLEIFDDIRIRFCRYPPNALLMGLVNVRAASV